MKNDPLEDTICHSEIDRNEGNKMKKKWWHD